MRKAYALGKFARVARQTPTARRATLHLQVTAGADLALANGLLHIAIADGQVDEPYIAARTSGFAEVRRAAAAYWPERVERITGVTVAEQRAAIRLLAGAERAVVLTARGAEQHSKGADTVSALINLALALGLPGTEGNGYGCLTGQGNGQGGREHRQKADQLPGYRRIDDPAAREHVAAVWGVDPARIPGPGRSAFELLDALGTPGGPRALLVMGSNVAVPGGLRGNQLPADRGRGWRLLAVPVRRSSSGRQRDGRLPLRAGGARARSRPPAGDHGRRRGARRCVQPAPVVECARGHRPLGAGVLGLEAARGLSGRGLPVTLIQRGPRLMERQLDADASRLLTRTVRGLGVDVRAGVGVRAVLAAEGKIKSLVSNGRGVLEAGLLVLCCGIRPRVGLARDAGLAVAVGIVVDGQLRSVTDQNVFAIGECAEHRGQTHGLVAPCWAQARAAAGHHRASRTGELPGPGDRDEAQGGRHRIGQPR